MGREPPLPPPRGDQTSVLLRQMLDGLPGERVPVGHIVAALRRRSFGGIVILLTLLGLVPVISFFAGLVLLIPALQMAAGFQAPALPRVIAEQEVPVARVRAIGGRALGWVEAAERYVRPRWLILTTPPAPMLTGLVVAALALVLLIPLPLINIPPALALLCLALGILERDGVLLLVGLAVAAAALALGGFAVAIAWEGIGLVLKAHFG